MSRPERLGLFGGSFDPIHLGHVEPVREACEQLELDRVAYLPTARPPHKRGRRFVASSRRFAMVELALLDDDRLIVDDFEMGDRPSFTIDTVRAFRPNRQLFLFLGADSLFELHRWKEWAEIVDSCELVVLRRPGYPVERESLPEALIRQLDWGRVHFLEHRQWEVSSTALRRRLAELDPEAGSGLPAGLLAAPVLQYIRKYALYRDDRASTPDPRV